MSFEHDQGKKKIQIRRTGNVAHNGRFFGSSSKHKSSAPNSTMGKDSLSILEAELKNLKRTVSRLSNFQYEHDILSTYKDRKIYISFINGSSTSGFLKDISKYQIIIQLPKNDAEDTSENLLHVYKSSIIYYQFAEDSL